MGRHTPSATLLICSFGLAACGRAVPDAARAAPVSVRSVVISTGGQGGNFYPVGSALAKAYETALPDIRPEVKATTGALTNLELLERGEADLAFSFANVSYAAFVGNLIDRPGSYAHLRALARLQLEPVQVVVSARSSAKTIKDLQGRRVPIGTGSGGALMANVLLRIYGVDAGTVKPAKRPYTSLDAGLAEGSIDAFIVLSRYPSNVVRRALAGGARLMPLVGDQVEQLHREHPFVRPMVIPAGVYPRQASPVQTIGVNSVLLCRDDLEEELVYRLTKALFQAMDGGHDELLQSIDLENVAATPIPLHPGAARYYRERELFP